MRERVDHRGANRARPSGAGVATTLGLGLVLGLGAAEPARAFDLFGLFGSEEAPPAPSPAALPYAVRFQGVEDEDLLRALQDTSSLYRLRNDAPPDGEGLLRRAEADAPRLVDALSGFGYYAGRVTFRIEDVVLGGDAAALAAVRAAEAARNRSLVAVRISVDQGPLYHLRTLTVLDPAACPSPRRSCRPASPASTARCRPARRPCSPARRR